MRPPKKGAEIKKDPTLKDASKSKMKNVKSSCNSNPGRAPNSLMIGNKLETLSGDFVKYIIEVVSHLGNRKSCHK